MKHQEITAALYLHILRPLQIHTMQGSLQPFDLEQLPNLPNLLQGFCCGSRTHIVVIAR